jgi:ATP-dependent DNA ligase
VERYGAAFGTDLEGVVAKWTRWAYQSESSGTSWLKVKNPKYTQMDGRRELFEVRRDKWHGRRARRAPELRLA